MTCVIERRQFLASPIALAGGLAASRPNVLVVLADDLGWRDTGFQGGDIPTPNIDRIAHEGVRFTRFYCTPLCTPTRASLMTGRSPMRYGLVYSVVRPWSHYGLPADEHVMAQTFQAAGYQTAIIGKWHLGHAHKSHLPNRRGFDHFYGHLNAEIDYYTHTEYGGLDWQRNGAGVREEGYTTDLLANEAVRWLGNRDRGRPFFLYLAFNAVHAPLQAPAQLVEKYAGIPNKSRRLYAAMLDSMDSAIGKVLSLLDRDQISRDTLVLFLSDNGGAPGSGAVNLPLRAGKLTVYEGGIRVAAAMRWPGHIPVRGEVGQVMAALDVFPTLAAASGLTPGNSKPLDGRNMWAAISKGDRFERENLFFAAKRNETDERYFAVRSGPWKLVQQLSADGPRVDQLFQLDEDPYEKEDLAARNRDLVMKLGAELDAWRTLHPKCDIQSSMAPHPGWAPPADYAQVAVDYEVRR